MEELYRVLAGSRLYGTNRPDSDVDLRMVVLEPIHTLIGLKPRFEVEQKIEGGVDQSTYGLGKFCNLALGANPNILELLFAKGDAIQFCHKDFLELRVNKFFFLSQKIRKTFGGYARGQIGLIDRKDYRPEGTKAHLIQRHGWDVKAGMHLYRLCQQGLTLLEDPEIYDPRLQGNALATAFSILNGEWSKEKLLETCENLVNQIDTVSSMLPNEPDFNHIQNLVMDIYYRRIRDVGYF